MSITILDARVITKHLPTSTAPTVPTVADHNTVNWLSTDVYKNELVINEDGRMYARNDADAILGLNFVTETHVAFGGAAILNSSADLRISTAGDKMKLLIGESSGNKGMLGLNKDPEYILDVKAFAPNDGRMYFTGNTLFLSTTGNDTKILQVNNDVSALGIVNIFLDPDKHGGLSVDKNNGDTMVKFRGREDDHSYINNLYVSVGRSGKSQAAGGTIDGARFTVADGARDPFIDLGDANNFQMHVVSNKDLGNTGVGIAFTNEAANKDVSVGGAFVFEKTGNGPKSDFHAYLNASTADLAVPSEWMWIDSDDLLPRFTSNGIVIETSQTPATAGADGVAGEIAWDSDYIYVCVATDTWKRVGISTW